MAESCSAEMGLQLLPRQGFYEVLLPTVDDSRDGSTVLP